MKKLIVIFTLLLGYQGTAQLAIGYFPWNYSAVQLASDPDFIVFADLRVETNSLINNMNFDLGINVNLLRREEFNLYIGPGISAYPFFNENEDFRNGYFLTTGIRWMPIAQLRQLGFIFEISPYVNENFESGTLRSFLGVSYQFGKK